MVDSNCEIQSDLESAVSALDGERLQCLVLIDGRPEKILQAVQKFADQTAVKSRTLLIITRSGEFLSALEVVSASAISDRISLVGMLFKRDLAYIEFRQSVAEDLDSTPFINGLVQGIESAGKIAVKDSDQSTLVSELEDKLLSVLESQKLIAPTPLSVESHQQGPKAKGDSQNESAATIKELENKLVTIRTQFDSLQRKYDALANSRLGRITLSAWSRNRKGSK